MEENKNDDLLAVDDFMDCTPQAEKMAEKSLKPSIILMEMDAKVQSINGLYKLQNSGKRQYVVKQVKPYAKGSENV